jgi:hypothetical protein
MENLLIIDKNIAHLQCAISTDAHALRTILTLLLTPLEAKGEKLKYQKCEWSWSQRRQPTFMFYI